jgi:hypothetical protein
MADEAAFIAEYCRRGKFTEDSCADAARLGYLAALQYLHGLGAEWGDTCTAAAKTGNIRILEWAHANNAPWDEDSCAGAAEHGQLETLAWLRARGCPWDGICFNMAAKHGHFAVLEWIWDANRRSGCACEDFCECGELCVWSVDTMAWAADEGRLDVVQWLHARGCPWDGDVLRSAKAHPKLHAWLVANGCPERMMLTPKVYLDVLRGRLSALRIAE